MQYARSKARTEDCVFNIFHSLSQRFELIELLIVFVDSEVGFMSLARNL